jgi:hypothetical protein
VSSSALEDITMTAGTASRAATTPPISHLRREPPVELSRLPDETSTSCGRRTSPSPTMPRFLAPCADAVSLSSTNRSSSGSPITTHDGCRRSSNTTDSPDTVASAKPSRTSPSARAEATGTRSAIALPRLRGSNTISSSSVASRTASRRSTRFAPPGSTTTRSPVAHWIWRPERYRPAALTRLATTGGAAFMVPFAFRRPVPRPAA